MSTPIDPHAAPKARPSTGPTVVVLFVLTLMFAVSVISFGTTIYHRENERIEGINADRQKTKYTPAPGMPPEPEATPEEFRWNTFMVAMLGGDARYGPAFLWSLLGLLTTAAAAGWLYQVETTTVDDLRIRQRLTALLVGGFIGFFTLLILGVGYTWHWWEKLTGSRANWKEWETWLPVGFMLLGLAVMFASMLPVRTEERRSATLRRIFYGYNTFLACLLLLGFLVVANVMTFFYFTHSFDWTATHIYSLSPAARQILASLDKPVKVYVLLDRNEQMRDVYTDVENLLNTCKLYAPKFEVEHIAPLGNAARYGELLQRHEVLLPELRGAGLSPEARRALLPWGLLVVYDEQVPPPRRTPEGRQERPFSPPKPASVFLSLNDLEEDIFSRATQASLTRRFQGEKALMSALTHLRDGELNHLLLFATGCGEMATTAGQAQAGQSPINTRSIQRLRERLRVQSGYESRTFPLGGVDPATKKARPLPSWVRMKTAAERTTLPFPEEDWVATTVEEKRLDQDRSRKYYRVLAVVLADPTQVSPQQVQVLGDYLKAPQGRLIALMDVHRDPEGKMRRLGLEDFLRGYGVLVRDEQILQAVPRLAAGQAVPQELQLPENIMAAISLEAPPSLIPLRQQLGGLLLSGARPVLPAAAQDNRMQAQTLLVTWESHWAEKAPLPNPKSFVDKLTAAQVEEKAMATQQQGLPVAVVVSQTIGSAPPAEKAEPGPTSGKLAVIGDATFLSDQTLARAEGATNYSLFTNLLAWLRGRPELISGFEPKTRASYRLGVRPEKLPIWSPGLILLAAITATGIGMTMLRRR